MSRPQNIFGRLTMKDGCIYKLGDHVGNYVVVDSVVNRAGLCTHLYVVEDDKRFPYKTNELEKLKKMLRKNAASLKNFLNPYMIEGKKISYLDALSINTENVHVSSAASAPNIKKIEMWRPENFVRYHQLHKMGMVPSINSELESDDFDGLSITNENYNNQFSKMGKYVDEKNKRDAIAAQMRNNAFIARTLQQNENFIAKAATKNKKEVIAAQIRNNALLARKLQKNQNSTAKTTRSKKGGRYTRRK
jgi:hypothetical protein